MTICLKISSSIAGNDAALNAALNALNRTMIRNHAKCCNIAGNTLYIYSVHIDGQLPLSECN